MPKLTGRTKEQQREDWKRIAEKKLFKDTHEYPRFNEEFVSSRSSTKLTIKCKEHNCEYKQSFPDHIKSKYRGCPECKLISEYKEFKNKIEKEHPGYTIEFEDYNNRERRSINLLEISSGEIRSFNRKTFKEVIKKREIYSNTDKDRFPKNKTLTSRDKDRLSNLKERLNYDNYEYPKLDEELWNVHSYLTIKCKKHDEVFTQRWDRHAKEKRNTCRCCDQEKYYNEFCEKLKILYPDNRYNITLKDYANSIEKDSGSISYQKFINTYCNIHNKYFLARSQDLSKGRLCCTDCDKDESKRRGTCQCERTPELIETIKILAKEGLGALGISRETGHSIGTIYSIAEEFGIELNSIASSGEALVKLYLEKENYLFTPQYILEGVPARGENEEWSARIDFAILKEDRTPQILIEYNGEQHFKYSEFLHKGDINEWKRQVRRDERVRKYCMENNILLIEIPFDYNTFDKISSLLDNILKNNISPSKLIDIYTYYGIPKDKLINSVIP